jgi:hypothetical protein
VDLLHPYVSGAIAALRAGGVRVESSWLDPCDPRDATVVIAGDHGTPLGLVWDEESGWRRGVFVAGAQGSRTVLDSPKQLGGGVLLSPAELCDRVTGQKYGLDRRYRSCQDMRDGLDDTLRLWANA